MNINITIDDLHNSQFYPPKGKSQGFLTRPFEIEYSNEGFFYQVTGRVGLRIEFEFYPETREDPEELTKEATVLDVIIDEGFKSLVEGIESIILSSSELKIQEVFLKHNLTIN